MSNPFLGEIRIFAGNFAPFRWAFCQGQLMSISQNTALFSILGTTYGGNGTSTFALPDLRSRIPMHMGSSPSGTYVEGEQIGQESVTLNQNQLPIHSHLANANPVGSVVSPQGHFWSTDPGGNTAAYDNEITSTNNVKDTMNPGAIGASGSDIPHDNMQPFLAINFIIALQGVFPTRN